MYYNNKQSGFTLVEIAIVLVIIGLLLGGILKGQELINSARVRNMADQNSGIQAAYFGFIDRYRQVPGDWVAANAAQAIGDPTVTLGGDGNGRIDNNTAEAAGVFSQLAKSNFLGGGFTPAVGDPGDEATYIANLVSPINAFNGSLILTRNAGFSGTAAIRLNLHMGTNVPVSISILPEVISQKSSRHLIKVVLPAPLTPINPENSPLLTIKSISSKTWLPVKDLQSFSI